MQKFLDAAHTDKSLQIASAMYTDVKGYIYVESFKDHMAHFEETILMVLQVFCGGNLIEGDGVAVVLVMVSVEI